MRKIVDYFRSLFCNHEWELVEKRDVYEGFSPKYEWCIGTKWIYICKKCKSRKIVKSY